jgi:transaldolase
MAPLKSAKSSALKFFVDTANLAEIEAVLLCGLVDGVTTNPSLWAKEPKGSFDNHVKKIINLLRKKSPGAHLSIEVFSTDEKEILRQARQFKKKFAYPHLAVKIQMGWSELAIINTLAKEGIAVNCTACMTASQALLAAKAGAKYVSLFWGRIRDGGQDERFKAEREKMLKDKRLLHEDFNPAVVVRQTRELLDKSGLASQIIVGSIRGVADIMEASLAGAHIITVPPKFFEPMAAHYKTNEVVGQFMSDFKNWLS